MLPKAVFTALSAAGLACLLAALVLLTALAPSRQVGGPVAVDGVLVTDPGVASLTGRTLVVEVTAAGPVFAGTARQVDVEAWVGSVPATRVTGLADDGSAAVRTVAGGEGVPDPRVSDVWADEAEGSGALTFAVSAPAPDSAVVVVADGATATLTWEREATHPIAAPLAAVGAALLLWGVSGLVRRNRHDRYRRRTAARPAPTAGRRVTAGTWSATAMVIGVVVTSTALTACAEVPRPAPDAAGEATGPAVSTDQAGRVLAAVGAGLAAGDGDRVTGPAAAWLGGAAAGVPTQPADGAAAVRAFAAAVGEQGDRVRRWPLLVPRTDKWPRSFAVSAPGPDGGSLVAVLVAVDAREPYRLWAALPVLADAALPPWPPAAEGAAPVDAAPVDAAPVDPARVDATGDSTGDSTGGSSGAGVAEVTATLTAHYADVLSEGAASEHAPEFAADPVSTGVRERVATVGTATRPAVVESTHVPDPGPAGRPVLALLDARGGGLVATAVTTTVRADARGDRTGVPVPEGYGPAAGTVSAPRNVEIVSTAALLFAVPPERGNIGPLAAADGITSVTAS